MARRFRTHHADRHSVLRPRKVDMRQAALAYAQHIHTTQRFKYEDGKYISHVISVARRLRSNEERIVALLHDVVEESVKRQLEENESQGHKNTAGYEEALIGTALGNIAQYFKNCGCGNEIGDLLPFINILTRRRTNPIPYDVYIKAIVADAHSRAAQKFPQPYIAVRVKLSDLFHNSEPKRNHRGSMLTDRDRARLANYAWAIAYITTEFPDLRLRSAKPRNPHRDLSGRPNSLKKRQKRATGFTFGDGNTESC